VDFCSCEISHCTAAALLALCLPLTDRQVHTHTTRNAPWGSGGFLVPCAAARLSLRERTLPAKDRCKNLFQLPGLAPIHLWCCTILRVDPARSSGCPIFTGPIVPRRVDCKQTWAVQCFNLRYFLKADSWNCRECLDYHNRVKYFAICWF